MSNPLDTNFWKDRWDRTCGYLVFKDKFSVMDVCNARFRLDDIQFDQKTYTIIQNRVKGPLDTDHFWAAVVAPTDAFFEFEWQDYIPVGRQRREMRLCRLINDKNRIAHLPKNKQDEALLEVGRELLKAGVFGTTGEKPAVLIPDPIKPLPKNYNAGEEAPTKAELSKAFDTLEEI